MRWFTLAAIVSLAVVVACTDGADDTGTPEARPETPTATAVSANGTPTLTDAAEPTPGATPTELQLSIDDAAYYLDVSSVLPGFRQVDPSGEGLSNADLGLGSDFSEVVVFLSDEPFQTVTLYMTVISGEINKAKEKSFLRTGGVIDSFVVGFESGPEGGEVKDLQVREVAVGDLGMLATLIAEFDGSRTPEEFLTFYQDTGERAALVFVLNVSSSGSAPAIDSITIAQEISARIDTR